MRFYEVMIIWQTVGTSRRDPNLITIASRGEQFRG